MFVHYEEGLLGKLLRDKRLALVLYSISKSFKTVEKISEECDISATTVYRKLKILEQNKYLEKSDKLTKSGRIRYFRKKPSIDILESIVVQK